MSTFLGCEMKPDYTKKPHAHTRLDHLVNITMF